MKLANFIQCSILLLDFYMLSFILFAGLSNGSAPNMLSSSCGYNCLKASIGGFQIKNKMIILLSSTSSFFHIIPDMNSHFCANFSIDLVCSSDVIKRLKFVMSRMNMFLSFHKNRFCFTFSNLQT